MPHAASPHPLVLTPILMPKVWGGQKLAKMGKSLPSSGGIGESWELADLPATAASGGGGQAARSVIASGPLAGRTLHDAATAWGADLLGRTIPTPGGDFPLLVKYLDAREHLSVQVHPSPAYAAAHPEAHLKTESWYILDAEPGAELFVGLKPGVTRDGLARAIEDGTVPSVLRTRPAVVGECHTLPSGTVHALGAGILIAEIQMPSDTTYRLYDWTKEYNRPVRETHIEQALACASFEEPPVARAASGERSVVAETPAYTVRCLRASCRAVAMNEGGDGSGPLVVMVTRTMGASISSRGGRFEEVMVQKGQTVVIPATLAADAVLRAGPDTEALVASIG